MLTAVVTLAACLTGCCGGQENPQTFMQGRIYALVNMVGSNMHTRTIGQVLEQYRENLGSYKVCTIRSERRFPHSIVQREFREYQFTNGALTLLFEQNPLASSGRCEMVCMEIGALMSGHPAAIGLNAEVARLRREALTTIIYTNARTGEQIVEIERGWYNYVTIAYAGSNAVVIRASGGIPP